MALHETFEPLEAPSSPRLSAMEEWYGNTVRPWSDFDILDFPEAAPWMSIVVFKQDDKGWYLFGESKTTFVGSEAASMLVIDMTGRPASQADEESLQRWGPFHWAAIKTRRPTFAKTFVHGVDKEFINYEVGGFPFKNEHDEISHVILLMEIV